MVNAGRKTLTSSTSQSSVSSSAAHNSSGPFRPRRNGPHRRGSRAVSNGPSSPPSLSGPASSLTDNNPEDELMFETLQGAEVPRNAAFEHLNNDDFSLNTNDLFALDGQASVFGATDFSWSSSVDSVEKSIGIFTNQLVSGRRSRSGFDDIGQSQTTNDC